MRSKEIIKAQSCSIIIDYKTKNQSEINGEHPGGKDVAKVLQGQKGKCIDYISYFFNFLL